VAVVGKKLQKSRPDFVNTAHVSPIANRPGLAVNSVISPGATLLDKGDGGVQKVCLGSGACRTSTGSVARPVDTYRSCVDSLGGGVFSSYL
jgi:hypothetical protein